MSILIMSGKSHSTARLAETKLRQQPDEVGESNIGVSIPTEDTPQQFCVFIPSTVLVHVYRDSDTR